MKKIILAGNLPYFAVALLCCAAFFVGQSTTQLPHDKFALAEKSAVILQAVLDRPSESAETFEHEIGQPIIKVLQRYADQGYTVLDSAKDEQGNFAVIAMPATSINITEELRAAIKAAQPVKNPEPSPKAVAQ